MNSIETTLIALSMTAGIAGFAALLLLARPSARRDQAVFLAGFLLLYAAFKANDVVTMTGGYAGAPILAVVTTPVRFLFGAAIFFYARSMTSPSAQWLRPHDALALIWPFAGFMAIIPFVTMSAQDKNSLMAQEFTSEEMRQWFLLTCKVIFGIFLASVFTYLIAAFRLLLRHTRTVRQIFSNIENKSLDWLRVILLVLAAGWSWNVVSGLWAIQGGRPEWVSVATAYFELAWIGAIAFCGMIQAPVFEEKRETGSDITAITEPSEKYARSALGEERMARIAANLEAAMTKEKRFEDPNLSLRALSDHLGVSEHYVSQTLNNRLGETFFDFVNRHRIAEARRRLETSDEQVAEIAHSVGYNSRSTFNAAFKKQMGLTPSAFRRAQKSGPGGAPDASFSEARDDPTGSYIATASKH